MHRMTWKKNMNTTHLPTRIAALQKPSASGLWINCNILKGGIASFFVCGCIILFTGLMPTSAHLISTNCHSVILRALPEESLLYNHRKIIFSATYKNKDPSLCSGWQCSALCVHQTVYKQQIRRGRPPGRPVLHPQTIILSFWGLCPKNLCTSNIIKTIFSALYQFKDPSLRSGWHCSVLCILKNRCDVVIVPCGFVFASCVLADVVIIPYLL